MAPLKSSGAAAFIMTGPQAAQCAGIGQGRLPTKTSMPMAFTLCPQGPASLAVWHRKMINHLWGQCLKGQIATPSPVRGEAYPPPSQALYLSLPFPGLSHIGQCRPSQTSAYGSMRCTPLNCPPEFCFAADRLPGRFAPTPL